MKKKLLTSALLLLCSMTVFSQEHEELYLLEADSTWLKEIIHFPLGFAPEINFQGYEDLRFAVDWKNQESAEFWTYAFVWKIDSDKALTVDELEANLKLYYDGIMRAVNKKKDFVVPETTVLFIEEQNDKGRARFKGKIRLYDSFHTTEMMTLNVQVEHYYCEKTKTVMPLFWLSPRPFEDPVWEKLTQVKLNDKSCDH